MKKIVFFNKSILSGGIEKCIENLSKAIHNEYEIGVCYFNDSIADINIINLISKYAKVTKIEDDTVIEADICIFCYLYFDYDKYKKNIKANKYYCWIHSMPRVLPNCLLDNKDFVDNCSLFICVSEAVKNHLNLNKDAIVIHNFINDDIMELANKENPLLEYNDKLKLCVISRISTGKGFERLYKLVNALENRKTNYILNIIGKGRDKEQEYRELFKNYENVKFLGYKDNPYCYLKNSDFLLQLSDYESWCNSITEAKILRIPIVVTNFESSYEQIEDGYNGIIVDLDEDDYDIVIDKMLNQKEYIKDNLKDFKYENEIDKWLEILKD